MLIGTAGDGIATFSDETSPDHRGTEGHKVVIYAQVLRSESLEWYIRLMSLYPDMPGEVESGIIAAQVRSLPSHLREQVWKGLARVRIHVADQRQHRYEVAKILEEGTASAIWRDLVR